MRWLAVAFITITVFLYSLWAIANGANIGVEDTSITLNITYIERPLLWITLTNFTIPSISYIQRPVLWVSEAISLPGMVYTARMPIIARDVIAISNLTALASKSQVLKVEPDLLYPGYETRVKILVWAVNETNVSVYYAGEPLAQKTIPAGALLGEVSFILTPGWSPVPLSIMINASGETTAESVVIPVDNRTEFQSLSWQYNGIELVATGSVVYENSSVPVRGETLYVLVNNQTVATLTINNGGFRVTLNPPINSTVALRLEHGETRTYHVTGEMVWPGGATGVPPLSLKPTTPGLASASEIYVALTAIAIYLFFATRWSDPFLALVPFGAIMSAYGSYAGSAVMIVTGAGGIIAGFLLKYLKG